MELTEFTSFILQQYLCIYVYTFYLWKNVLLPHVTDPSSSSASQLHQYWKKKKSLKKIISKFFQNSQIAAWTQCNRSHMEGEYGE